MLLDTKNPTLSPTSAKYAYKTGLLAESKWASCLRGRTHSFFLRWSFLEILSENAVGQHVWGSGYKLDFRWPNHSLHSFEACLRWGAWGMDRSSGLSRLDLINELHNLSLRQIIWDSRVLSGEAKKFKGLLETRCCISCINSAVMTQLS